MANVNVVQEQVVIADSRSPIALSGAAMNRRILADPVSVADDHVRRFTSIFQILIHFADGGKLPDNVITANTGEAVNADMRGYHRVITNLDASCNDAERANADARTDNRPGSIKLLLATRAEGEIDIALS